MKTKITLLVLLSLAWSAVGWAQMGGDGARLMGAMEKTDEVIARAREAVQESGSEQAHNQLEMAINLQKMARDVVAFGPMNEMMVQRAGKYTLNAREKAQRAIAITRQAAENEDYVRGRLERTDDLIRQIEERVGPDASEGLRLMLDSAHDKQQRAVELFRNRRLKASLQMTLQVEKSLKDAAGKSNGYQKTQQRYQAQTERYLALRERIRLSEDINRPEVKRALENAENLQTQADEMVSGNGRYGQAEKTMQKAVEILTRAAEDLREPAKIKTAIEDVEKMAAYIESQVDQYGDRAVKQQYQSAHDHLNKASASYDRGDYNQAAAQVQAARQIMTQVAETVEKPVMVEQGLELVHNEAARLEAKVGASGDRRLQTELTEAREMLAKATALYRAGDYAAAQAQLETAERTLARIANFLGE